MNDTFGQWPAFVRTAVRDGEKPDFTGSKHCNAAQPDFDAAGAAQGHVSKVANADPAHQAACSARAPGGLNALFSLVLVRAAQGRSGIRSATG